MAMEEEAAAVDGIERNPWVGRVEERSGDSSCWVDDQQVSGRKVR